MRRLAQAGCAVGCSVVFLLIAAVSPARAQIESLTGTLGAGVYSLGSTAVGTVVPMGVDLDARGYLGHRDFLSFSVQPWFNFGDPFGGIHIRPGNGLSVSANLLRRRAFPVSLAYSISKSSAVGLDPQGINFGFGRLAAANQARDFSVSGSLRVLKLPVFSYSYGRSRRSSESNGLRLPFRSTGDGENFQVGLSYLRFGWDWRLTYGGGKSVTNVGRTASGVLLDTKFDFSDLVFSGHGPVWSLGQVIVSLERSTRDDALGDRGRASKTSRALISFNSQPVQPLSLTASVLAQSGRFQGRFLPISPAQSADNQLDSYSANLLARYRIHSDWTILGGVAQSTGKTKGPDLIPSRSSSFSGSMGVAYSHTYRWATLVASYSRTLSRADLSTRSQAEGQDTMQVALQGGRFGSFTWEANAQYSRRNLDGFSTSLVDVLTSRNRDLSVTYSMSRMVSQVRLQGTVSLQRGSSLLREQAGGESKNRNVAFALSAEHRRFHIEYNRNLQEQSSPLPFSSGLESFLTSLNGDTLRARVNPLTRLETEVLYRRFHSALSLPSPLESNSSNLIVTLRYRFRALDLEGGYNRWSIANFLSEAGRRSGFYFRVHRRFRML